MFSSLYLKNIMSEVRVIKLNEDLFKIPSGTQRKKPDKPIKIKQPRKVSDKTLRNRVLNEIRKNQEQHYRSLLEEAPVGSLSGRERAENKLPLGGTTEAFNKDFDQSLEYMNQLAGKVKEEEKARNTTLKLNNYTQSDDFSRESSVMNEIDNLIPVQLTPTIDRESISLKPALPYGCMKVGGTLPTYRTYHGTLKTQPSLPVLAQQIKEPFMKPQSMDAEPIQIVPADKPLVSERILSPTEVAHQEKAKQDIIKPKIKRVKKLLRRTYRSGKDKFKPRVGVLLSNKTIRSNITTKAYMLKQTPIEEIRKTLVKKGFIKHGSSAPNDVLRKIFESIQMIGGEVNNYNADNLLYNFFETKE